MAGKSKTGLTAKMRGWMQDIRTPFSAGAIFVALADKAIVAGQSPAPRKKILKCLEQFRARGEIIFLQKIPGRGGGINFYRYAAPPRPPGRRGAGISRICKAVYICITFTVAEVAQLAECRDYTYAARVIRCLERGGLIKKIGIRKNRGGAGNANLYHVPDRDRYKLEVLNNA